MHDSNTQRELVTKPLYVAAEKGKREAIVQEQQIGGWRTLFSRIIVVSFSL